MNEADHTLIESYNRGELSEVDMQNFRERLSNDHEFAAMYEDYTTVENLLESAVEDDLRASFREIDELRKSDSPAKETSSIPKNWIIATILGGLLIVSMALWKQIVDIDKAEIAQSYAVYEYTDKARDAYEIVDSTIHAEYYVFMKDGNRLIEEGKYEAARKSLENIRYEQTIPRENKEWMILLTYYLQYGRSNKDFQRMLNEILDKPEHTHYGYAVKLDNEVNSFWGRLKE